MTSASTDDIACISSEPKTSVASLLFDFLRLSSTLAEIYQDLQSFYFHETI